MIEFTILHLEDDDDCAENFKTTLDIYNEKNNTAIKYIHVNNFEDFKKYTDLDYDVAVIDIYLGKNPVQGYDAISMLPQKFMRIPCVIYSGTVDADIGNKFALKTYKRDQHGADVAILDYFVNIYKTGILNILGGKGQLEQILSCIYNNNLRHNIEEWLSLAEVDSPKCETALLRFIGHCIEDKLHTDCEKTYSAEVYISPLLNKELSPGLIICDNNDNKFIIITPACDLALHNESRNTDTIQLCCIENITKHFPGTSNSAKDKRRNVLENKKNMFHYLPKSKMFEGGLINFQGLKTIEISELEKGDYRIIAKITSSYLKNILARFSNYYARQGQPDISFNIEEIEHEIAEQSKIR